MRSSRSTWLRVCPPASAFLRGWHSGSDSAAGAPPWPPSTPEADTLTLIDRRDQALQQDGEVPLPAMSRPPVPGRLPWDPVGDSPAQRRAVAVDPTGALVAVSRGGDSEVHLVGEDRFDTFTVPTALDEGGQLYWPGAGRDPVGR